MTNMRIIVTGSRDWPSRDIVWESLAWVLNENVEDGETLTVVHGDCPTGADRFAAEWCHLPDEPGYHVTIVEERHPADLSGFEMVDAGADLVLAFPLPGPKTRSRGTWDCIDAAEAAGITVEVKELEFQPRFTFEDVAEAVAEVRE